MTIYRDPTPSMDAALERVLAHEDHQEIRDWVTIQTMAAYKDGARPALMQGLYRALGMVKKTSYLHRAAGLEDIVLLIDGDYWEEIEQAIAGGTEEDEFGPLGDHLCSIIDHEIAHVAISFDADEPFLDKAGRPVVNLKPHDYQLGFLTSTARRYGASSMEARQMRRLAADEDLAPPKANRPKSKQSSRRARTVHARPAGDPADTLVTARRPRRALVRLEPRGVLDAPLGMTDDETTMASETPPPSMLVVPVKPEHIQNILLGRKTLELRRVAPKLAPMERVALLETKPGSGKIVAVAAVGDVWTLDLDQLWTRFAMRKAAVSRHDFDNYFSGKNEGTGLMFARVWRMAPPLDVPFKTPQGTTRWKNAPKTLFAF